MVVLSEAALTSLTNGGYDLFCTHFGVHRGDIKGRSFALTRTNDIFASVTSANSNFALVSGLVQQVGKMLTGF